MPLAAKVKEVENEQDCKLSLNIIEQIENSVKKSKIIR